MKISTGPVRRALPDRSETHQLSPTGRRRPVRELASPTGRSQPVDRGQNNPTGRSRPVDRHQPTGRPLTRPVDSDRSDGPVAAQMLPTIDLSGRPTGTRRPVGASPTGRHPPVDHRSESSPTTLPTGREAHVVDQSTTPTSPTDRSVDHPADRSTTPVAHPQNFRPVGADRSTPTTYVTADQSALEG